MSLKTVLMLVRCKYIKISFFLFVALNLLKIYTKTGIKPRTC